MGLTGPLAQHAHLTGEEKEAQKGTVARPGPTVSDRVGSTRASSFPAGTCPSSTELVLLVGGPAGGGGGEQGAPVQGCEGASPGSFFPRSVLALGYRWPPSFADGSYR